MNIAIKIGLIILGLFALSFSLLILLTWMMTKMLAPLPIEQDRVQPIVNVDICREVESGALDVRTKNSCKPNFNN